MHQHIVSIIAQIRQEVAIHLSPTVIHKTCNTVGHVWRKFILEPATVVHVLILQVLHGNKLSVIFATSPGEGKGVGKSSATGPCCWAWCWCSLARACVNARASPAAKRFRSTG